MLAAMTTITGDFVHAIHEMSKVLNVKGKYCLLRIKVLSFMQKWKMVTLYHGESKIPNYGKKIKRVFLTPEDVIPLT